MFSGDNRSSSTTILSAICDQPAAILIFNLMTNLDPLRLSYCLVEVSKYKIHFVGYYMTSSTVDNI